VNLHHAFVFRYDVHHRLPFSPRITLQSIVQHYPQSQAAQTAAERLKLLR